MQRRRASIHDQALHLILKQKPRHPIFCSYPWSYSYIYSPQLLTKGQHSNVYLLVKSELKPGSPCLFSLGQSWKGPVCAEGVRFGDLRIRALALTGEIVLSASWGHNLQMSLLWFVAKCDGAEMKISTYRSETSLVSQKRVEGPLQVRDNVLPPE